MFGFGGRGADEELAVAGPAVALVVAGAADVAEGSDDGADGVAVTVAAVEAAFDGAGGAALAVSAAEAVSAGFSGRSGDADAGRGGVEDMESAGVDKPGAALGPKATYPIAARAPLPIATKASVQAPLFPRRRAIARAVVPQPDEIEPAGKGTSAAAAGKRAGGEIDARPGGGGACELVAAGATKPGAMAGAEGRPAMAPGSGEIDARLGGKTTASASIRSTTV